MEMGPWLKVSSYRLLKPVIEIYDPWFTRRVVYPLHQGGSIKQSVNLGQKEGTSNSLNEGLPIKVTGKMFQRKLYFFGGKS